MRRLRTRLLTVMFTLLALGISAGVSGAANSAHDNFAYAANTQSGSYVYEFAFSLRRSGAVVDETNTAIAYSHCESCRTVAIAIQVVLVMPKPKAVRPQNLALALNDTCTLCETLATAHQFVIGRGKPVRLSDAGKARIAEIRRQFEELRTTGDELTFDQVRARITALVAELRDVLANEVNPVGERLEEREGEEAAEGDDETGSSERTVRRTR